MPRKRKLCLSRYLKISGGWLVMVVYHVRSSIVWIVDESLDRPLSVMLA